MRRLGNCAISSTLHPTTLPSLKEMELYAQTVITARISRFGLFDLVTGLFGDIHETTRQLFSSAAFQSLQ